MDKVLQPRVRSVKYAIDVFPEDRNVSIQGEEVIYKSLLPSTRRNRFFA